MRAVAVGAVLLSLALAAGACDNADESKTDDANPTAGKEGPLPGDDATSCVSTYRADTLAQQSFAFDGVVVSIGESVSDREDSGDLGLPGVTFEVKKWFAGGRGGSATVDMPVGPNLDGEVVYGPGSRLLVSGQPRWGGDDLRKPIAWSCGFTRYYDESEADDWTSAFAAE